MTQQLEKAFAEASKLSAEDQIAFAAWIRAELDSESRWTELFAQSQDMLAKLADEALAAATEETLEEKLAAIRRARVVTAVSEIQRRSVERGTDGLSFDEINAEIAVARRERHRRFE